MALSPWKFGRGVFQGRITPTGISAPAGSFVFCLGADDAGRFVDLKPGDFFQVQQNGAANDARFLRARIRVRAPSSFPVGAKWQFYVKLGAQELVTWDILHPRTYDDVQLPLPSAVFGAAAFDLIFGLRLVNTGAGAVVLNVELPAVYIDDVIFETPAVGVSQLRLAQRRGGPGELGVKISDHIELDLINGDTQDPPSILQVYVNGALAYDLGTGFQAGFNGAGSALSTPGGGARGIERVVIDPTVSLAILSLVTVRVIGIGASAGELDETYSFTTEDLVNPRVLSGSGRDLKLARVLFNEAMKMTDATATDDALRAANYVFAGVSIPTAEVSPVSVTKISNAEVEVLVNIPFSPGGTYSVTVSNAKDLFGNAVIAPNNKAEFVAFRPPQPAGRSFDLYSKLAGVNRRLDLTLDLKLFIACLQDIADLLLYDLDKWTEILDPDFAPEAFVDAMLADLGNPFPFDLELVDKRRLLRVLVDIYKQKGTNAGIVNAIRFFLGIEVEVVEWLAEGLSLGESELGIDWILAPGTSRDRYSYEIVSPVILTETQRDQITEIATYMHPAHTHLRQIVEPPPVLVIDHLELGLSELGGDEWQLH